MQPAPDENDRFGMPDSAFEAALDNHGRSNPVFRVGMYVPTRGEVAKLPADDLRSIPIDWMWESPTELIPSNGQIAEVLAVLRSRPDVATPEVQDIIEACEAYLRVQGAAPAGLNLRRVPLGFP